MTAFLLCLPVFVSILLAMLRQQKTINALRNELRYFATEGQTRSKMFHVKAGVHGDRLNGLGKRDDHLERRIDAQDDRLNRLGHCIDHEQRRVDEAHSRIDKLTPDKILAALEQKEVWLATAIERIDNGIGNARALGEAAGETAARNLIRECIMRAARGEGPPLQVMPQDFVNNHLAIKAKSVAEDRAKHG